jgi:PAS domain S-box-containing protein
MKSEKDFTGLNPDKFNAWNTLILESIEVALLGLDKAWHLTYSNVHAAKTFERTRESLLGQSVWEEFPNLSRSNLEKFFREVMIQARPGRTEEFCSTRQVWYEIWAYPISPGLIISCQDITASKLLAQSLRESEYRFKVLSDATFEGVVILRDGIVIEANQSAAELYGYNNPQELIGVNIRQHLTSQSLEVLQRRRSEGSQGSYEVMVVRKDGAHLPVIARDKAIEYLGQPARIVAGRDLTELKQAEETLRKTQLQLLHSQKIESIGRLAGGVAHDFNNFLTVIQGYSELLTAELKGQILPEQYLLEIQKAAQRATTLTQQILAFSRRRVLQPRVINLNKVVEEMGKMLERLVGEDIELISLLDPTLGSIWADTGQLEQILLNLTVNARDAMPGGGNLTIHTENVELSQEISGFYRQVRPGKYVLLTVTDTGEGMDKETLSHIFEPFFTTKEEGRGTGLGLATVYGIVEQGGGNIQVFSEKGLGTIFKIYLPRVDEKDEEEETKVAGKRVNGRETLLVVEDDELVRVLINRIMTRYGYRVLLANDGWKALAICQKHVGNIDILLSDLVMPQMSGQELADQARQMRPGIKVLFMSGYNRGNGPQEGRLAEEEELITKPFTPDELARKVREVLDGKE